MENKKITLIFGILSVVLLAVIIGGIVFVMKPQNGRETGMLSENKAGVTESDTEASTEPETEEETQTEQVTEAITEVEIQTTELTVEDDMAAPVFLTFSKTCEVKQGAAFDVHDYVGYGDDVDRNPELTVEGTVDTSVLGTYPLTLTLTDEAGHVTSDSMSVQVVSELTPYQGGSKMEFETFYANYKREGTVLGIDVSRWQEDIDFTQVKNAGCEFAFIRIGGYDDGSQYEDRYYRTNIRNAKAAGLQVGVYWHAEEGSIQEIKSNVAYMMGLLDGETLDFPIAYDWEDFNGFEKYGMNLYDLNACFEAFCDEVESYGYNACLYSSKNYLENVWTNANGQPVWLAHYTSQTTYAGEYFMWQKGSNGRIAGIQTDVDFDVLYLER